MEALNHDIVHLKPIQPYMLTVLELKENEIQIQNRLNDFIPLHLLSNNSFILPTPTYLDTSDHPAGFVMGWDS